MIRSLEYEQPVVGLAEKDLALTSYLDMLLAEVDELLQAPSPVEVEVLDAVPSPSEGLRFSPNWSKTPFQTLLFEVEGVSLAVPLVCLSEVAAWDGQCAAVPKQPKWMLGVLMRRDELVGIIDTAQLIMPERSGGECSKGYLLLVDEGRIGLVVDRVCETTTLVRGDVCWAREASRRVWMAGVMIEQLVVLLEVDGLVGMING